MYREACKTFVVVLRWSSHRARDTTNTAQVHEGAPMMGILRYLSLHEGQLTGTQWTSKCDCCGVCATANRVSGGRGKTRIKGKVKSDEHDGGRNREELTAFRGEEVLVVGKTRWWKLCLMLTAQTIGDKQNRDVLTLLGEILYGRDSTVGWESVCVRRKRRLPRFCDERLRPTLCRWPISA